MGVQVERSEYLLAQTRIDFVRQIDHKVEKVVGQLEYVREGEHDEIEIGGVVLTPLVDNHDKQIAYNTEHCDHGHEIEARYLFGQLERVVVGVVEQSVRGCGRWSRGGIRVRFQVGIGCIRGNKMQTSVHIVFRACAFLLLYS